MQSRIQYHAEELKFVDFVQHGNESIRDRIKRDQNKRTSPSAPVSDRNHLFDIGCGFLKIDWCAFLLFESGAIIANQIFYNFQRYTSR